MVDEEAGEPPWPKLLLGGWFGGLAEFDGWGGLTDEERGGGKPG